MTIADDRLDEMEFDIPEVEFYGGLFLTNHKMHPYLAFDREDSWCSPSRMMRLLGDESLSITYHRWVPSDEQHVMSKELVVIG